MSTDNASQIELLFPIPIIRGQMLEADRINPIIEQVIRDKMAVCSGIVRTNAQGWHSKLEMQSWSNIAVQSLFFFVKEQASKFIMESTALEDGIDSNEWQIEAWANVNSSGASNNVHTHDTKGGVILSGFYYVSLGQPESTRYQGNTYFVDRDNYPKHYNLSPILFGREIDNIPKLGEVILFPSWLPHGVREYRGIGERITIAFNLTHPELKFTKITDIPSPQWAWRYFPLIMHYLKRLRNKYLKD